MEGGKENDICMMRRRRKQRGGRRTGERRRRSRRRGNGRKESGSEKERDLIGRLAADAFGRSLHSFVIIALAATTLGRLRGLFIHIHRIHLLNNIRTIRNSP